MTASVLVLDSGLHQKRAFGDFENVTLRPISEVRPRDLFGYDAVIVPFHADQNVLSTLKAAMVSFLEKGGNVVVLGAGDLAKKDWIPGCNWSDKESPGIIVAPNTPAHYRTLFAEITADDLFFHRGGRTCAQHGSLVTTGSTERVDVLIRASGGEVVMLGRQFPGGGTLLVTTLDPDHHAVLAAPGPEGESSAVVQQRARMFLNNILKWCEERCTPSKERKVFRDRRAVATWLRKAAILSAPGVLGFLLQYLLTPARLGTSGELAGTIVSAGIVATLMGHWTSLGKAMR